MYRIILLISFFMSCAVSSQAALHRLHGVLADSTGSLLAGASISLLYPEDSTLAFFSISNDKGIFEIADVSEGNYVLQVALMGYYTEYRTVQVTSGSHDRLGAFLLKSNGTGHLLNEVVISGEKVPLRVKGDTLEYNAGSYKVKPDAMVEDLLRKLPGVQVDQEGNIKSMGKDVTKVLVDGKEFFGSDPKVATKNLPADAVDKVQAFEKKSDQSLFSGIDDGQREQTLNLKLKEGRKAGYFGEAQVAGGLPEKYEASLRAFKFREKSQLSALGMINNINKFGFSFQDYINFNGGISSLMNGGGQISMNANEVPVDFGQPVTGDVTSGALGLNYSIEPRPGSRWNINYMGNGVKKLLDQYVSSRNLTATGNFDKQDQAVADSRTLSNRLATSWRSETDSVHLLTFNGHAQLGSNTNDQTLHSTSYTAISPLNSLNNTSAISGNSMDIGGSAGWVKKRKGSWPLLQARLEGSYTRKREESQWHNLVQYPAAGTELTDEQYQNNEQRKAGIAANVSAVRKVGKELYLEPSLGAGFDRDERYREQGLLNGVGGQTDSLSPQFYRNILTLRPALHLKKSKKFMQWNIGLEVANLWQMPALNGVQGLGRRYHYLLPSASWQKDIASGNRVSVNYSSDVTTPGAAQLMPATDYSNPLLRTSGNPDLKPEYAHNLSLNYNRFDQFTMSSFFVMLNGKYTKDKIDWSRTVFPDLSQRLQTINTPYAMQLRMSSQYARPVRKLGIQASVGLNETWDKTRSPVNGVYNAANTWTHELEANINNLNNNKWDIRLGGNVRITDARYSINSELNNTYYNYSLNAKTGYTPGDNWYFGVSCDMTHYSSQNFDKAVTIPILKAEISRYIFPGRRGTITLRGFDLLDRNKAIQRVSQVNFQMEQRSNTIGRYVLLSFAYKLNRSGKGGGGIEIIQ